MGVTTPLETIYQAHRSFVRQALLRFGVPERDCPDEVHEVFIVVGRKLSSYEWQGALTTWLYGIARRVAAAYRRRAVHRYEQLVEEGQVETPSAECPYERARCMQARGWVLEILDSMSPEQRAAFTMYELQGLTGREIAERLGIPLQTVFSRLRRARRVYDRHVARMQIACGVSAAAQGRSLT